VMNINFMPQDLSTLNVPRLAQIETFGQF
jgi:hypothetical protein